MCVHIYTNDTTIEKLQLVCIVVESFIYSAIYVSCTIYEIMSSINLIQFGTNVQNYRK